VSIANCKVVRRKRAGATILLMRRPHFSFDGRGKGQLTE
jgi:hypothetical protein